MATVIVNELKLGRINLNADNIEFLRIASLENQSRFLVYLHSGKVLEVDDKSYKQVSAIFGCKRWGR